MWLRSHPLSFWHQIRLFLRRLFSHHLLPFSQPSTTIFTPKRIPIINISLESGKLRVDAAGFVSSECYDKQGQQRIAKYNNTASFKTSNSSTFRLSTRNRFTILGCRTVGVSAGEKGKPYQTGCVGSVKRPKISTTCLAPAEGVAR